MAFDDHGEVRVGLENTFQDLGVMRESAARVAANIELVVIEISVLRFTRQNIDAG